MEEIPYSYCDVCGHHINNCKCDEDIEIDKISIIKNNIKCCFCFENQNKCCCDLTKKHINQIYNILSNVEKYILPKTKIKIIKLSEKECGIMPSRGTKKSAGWDIYTPIFFELKSKSEIVIDTLTCWEIPDGYYGDIRTKSGLRFNKKIINYHGVIDSDFRQSLKILIENKTDNDYMFDVGDKICQMIITPYLTTDLELVDELNIPEEEHKGFGSTGK